MITLTLSTATAAVKEEGTPIAINKQQPTAMITTPPEEATETPRRQGNGAYWTAGNKGNTNDGNTNANSNQQTTTNSNDNNTTRGGNRNTTPTNAPPDNNTTRGGNRNTTPTNAPPLLTIKTHNRTDETSAMHQELGHVSRTKMHSSSPKSISKRFQKNYQRINRSTTMRSMYTRDDDKATLQQKINAEWSPKPSHMQRKWKQILVVHIPKASPTATNTTY